MTKNFETSIGNITVKDVMIDLDGTNLDSGISVLCDDEVITEIAGMSTDNVNENNIEEIINFI